MSTPLCFAFRGNELLVRAGQVTHTTDAWDVTTTAQAELPCPPAITAPEHALAFNALDGRPCLVWHLPTDSPAPPDCAFVGLRGLYGALPDDIWHTAGRAIQMLNWDQSHKFCGRCGLPTEKVSGEHARACPTCKVPEYPRLSPAILVLVHRGDELLLGRSYHFPPGRYSTLAGFVEAGETIEQAVCREVREETGVEITNLRYFGSQPWPFPHSLMIAFTAEYAGGDIQPQEAEMEDVQWFHVDALPDLPPAMSIARHVIDAFLEGRI